MAANNPRIWDYLNAITHNKDRSVLDDNDFEKVYNPFIINTMLSQHEDCVLAANLMNERSWCDRKLQFLFLLNTLRARFRRNEKREKTTVEDDVYAVAEYYGISLRHARDLVRLHSSDQLTTIHRRLDKGGTASKRVVRHAAT